jgi:iron complex outermembrane receptor protein
VLVLVNGKRVHPTAIVNVESAVGLGSVAVDFASIPVNAVRRVEVLRDGAGAQYGSDAIAGVINIILDDAPGADFEFDTGEFVTHFAPTDRSLRDGQTVDLQGGYGVALPGGGFVRAGLEASHHNPTNRAGFDQFYPYAPFYGNGPANVVTFHVGDAQISNVNLWLNSAFPVAGAQGYATALYNHRKSTGDAFFREPGDTYANTGSNSNNVPDLYPNGFVPESTGTNQDLHLNGGLRGLAGGWNYDASLTYGMNDFSYGLTNSVNASYGDASPTTFHLAGSRFTQATANLDLSGDLPLFGLAQAPSFAWGGEFRREGYTTSAGDPASYLAGPVANSSPASQGDGGLSPANTSDLSRTVGGFYADLSASITPSVFAEAAARWDHYSDVGSAATSKLSGRWELVQGLALRAAFSNNFRAPALAQVGAAYSPTTYVSGGSLGGVQILPVASPIAQALGAQPLKPERSQNFSLGLTLQDSAGLQLSVDWFHIDISDRIALSQQISLSTALGNAPAGTYQFFTNAVDTTTQGVDVVAAWTTRVADGDLRLSDASTFTSNNIRDIHAQPAQLAGLGLGNQVLFGYQAQNAITTALPKRRDVVSAHWSDSSWGLLARVTRTGEVERVFDFGTPGSPSLVNQAYNSTVQLDLEGEWKPTKVLSLALGAQNLTDRYPTLSSSAINYGGNLPYDFLSPIGMNGRYLYGRVRFTLR